MAEQEIVDVMLVISGLELGSRACTLKDASLKHLNQLHKLRDEGIRQHLVGQAIRTESLDFITKVGSL